MCISCVQLLLRCHTTPAKMPYNPWFAAMGEDGEPAQKCTPALRLYNHFCSLGASLARKGFFYWICSCYLSFSDAKSCLECKNSYESFWEHVIILSIENEDQNFIFCFQFFEIQNKQKYQILKNKQVFG